MFSKTCEYAIRALIYIAQKAKNGEKVGIKDIAVGIDSPEYFIAKILQELSRKGYVQSVKGPNGGFYMSKENLEMSLTEIAREIDGDKLFTSCGLGLKECSEDHPCPIHNQFKYIKQDMKNMLENFKIKMLAEGIDSNLTFLKVADCDA